MGLHLAPAVANSQARHAYTRVFLYYTVRVCVCVRVRVCCPTLLPWQTHDLWYVRSTRLVEAASKFMDSGIEGQDLIVLEDHDLADLGISVASDRQTIVSECGKLVKQVRRSVFATG